MSTPQKMTVSLYYKSILELKESEAKKERSEIFEAITKEAESLPKVFASHFPLLMPLLHEEGIKLEGKLVDTSEDDGIHLKVMYTPTLFFYYPGHTQKPFALRYHKLGDSEPYYSYYKYESEKYLFFDSNTNIDEVVTVLYKNLIEPVNPNEH